MALSRGPVDSTCPTGLAILCRGAVWPYPLMRRRDRSHRRAVLHWTQAHRANCRPPWRPTQEKVALEASLDDASSRAVPLWARFCMRRALVKLLRRNASLFRLRGKRSRAPPAREIMGVTVEQAHCSELATVTVVPDRRRPFSAEVPSGPIRSCVVVTEVIAAPLHWTPSAPGKLPTAVATNTRE